jgi:hypothetical protein
MTFVVFFMVFSVSLFVILHDGECAMHILTDLEQQSPWPVKPLDGFWCNGSPIDRDRSIAAHYWAW